MKPGKPYTLFAEELNGTLCLTQVVSSISCSMYLLILSFGYVIFQIVCDNFNWLVMKLLYDFDFLSGL